MIRKHAAYALYFGSMLLFSSFMLLFRLSQAPIFQRAQFEVPNSSYVLRNPCGCAGIHSSDIVQTVGTIMSEDVACN